MAQEKTSSSPSLNDDEDSYSFSYSYNFLQFCDNNSYGTLAVVNSTVTVLGVVCSLLLIVIICKNYALRGDKYILLNNLLLASLLLLVVSGFMYIEKALNPCWAAGEFLCKFTQILKTVLTNTSTFFLIALSVQQLNRYRQKFVTVFNATHARCMIVTGALWGAAVILSLPEFFLAKVLYYVEGFSMCDVYHNHHRQRLTSAAKILFFEYVCPLLILLVIIVITGVYVVAVKSRYTHWGVTTGGSLVPRDDNHPKHFALIVTLSVIYLIGYFPLYSFELATFLEAIRQRQVFRLFWWYMDLVSTFFVLLPPALTPLAIMLLSWKHLDILKSVYGRLSIVDVETPQPADGCTDVKVDQGTTNESSDR